MNPELGKRAAEETRQEIRAILRELDDRFVHQVLEHGLAADIDDEGDAGLNRYEICEVLIGPHANICAAGVLFQIGNDSLKQCLVRNKIVGVEGTTFFGKLRNHLPEGFVADLFGQILGVERADKVEARDQYGRPHVYCPVR